MPSFREKLKDHPVLSILAGLSSIATIWGFYFVLNSSSVTSKEKSTYTDKNNSFPNPKETKDSNDSPKTSNSTIEIPITEPGYYIANATEKHRVYFHNSPDPFTKRKAYMNTQEEVLVQKIVNGFGYIEFTNDRGEKSFGWLSMSDLIVKPK